jgi:outer membrane immunogenic protein
VRAFDLGQRTSVRGRERFKIIGGLNLNPIKASVAGLMVFALCSPAHALDTKHKRAKEAYAQSEPKHQWTGFYGGLNLGYGIAGISDSAPLAVNSAMHGVVGGAQLGYNYQTGSIVLGIEADMQASDQSASATWSIPGLGDLTVGHKIPYFGTLRGRLGYAFSCGCVMAYGTLGIAYGAYEPFATALGTTVSQTYTNSSALAAGVGVEWMVAQQWSVKLEALYIDTGNVGGLTLPVIGTIHARVRDAITRLGVNYHF